MLVASKDKILDLETVGYADLAAKKPMAADALFWIASMTKPMTAAAVMMLVDERRLKLDDPVETYLPAFKGQVVIDAKDSGSAPRHPITIREILCHTSGLPFKSAAETGALDALPLAEAVDSYARTPLGSEPGEAYVYSNAGINTAARIVEIVTGLSYERFMDERFFQPLGMHDTTFWPDAAQLQRLAKSYAGQTEIPKLKEKPINQLTYPLDDRTRRFPMPAGGLFSTARDCARFCQMCLNGGVLEGRRYLSEEAVQEMATRQTDARLENSYGLGWGVGVDGEFSHGGAQQTLMGVYPRLGMVTVFMVQQEGWVTDEGRNAGPTFIRAAQALAGGREGAPIKIEGQATRR